MKIILLTLTFIFLNSSNEIYRNIDWMIEINLSGLNITVETYKDTDTLLNSDFSKFRLEKMHCNIENIDFYPEIRILDKYLSADTLNFKYISDELRDYSEINFEVLQSAMYPDDLGQSFNFVIQKENKHIFLLTYHLINVDNKNFLIESLSTFGTKREIEKKTNAFIKRIKAIKI